MLPAAFRASAHLSAARVRHMVFSDDSVCGTFVWCGGVFRRGMWTESEMGADESGTGSRQRRLEQLSRPGSGSSNGSSHKFFALDRVQDTLAQRLRSGGGSGGDMALASPMHARSQGGRYPVSLPMNLRIEGGGSGDALSRFPSGHAEVYDPTGLGAGGVVGRGMHGARWGYSGDLLGLEPPFMLGIRDADGEEEPLCFDEVRKLTPTELPLNPHPLPPACLPIKIPILSSRLVE